MVRIDVPSTVRTEARRSRGHRWKPAAGWIGAILASLAVWWGVAELIF